MEEVKVEREEENKKKEEGETTIRDEEVSLEELAKRIEELEKEKAELTDRLLRLQAEFDNFRKRTKKEMEEFKERAHETILCDILYVLDNIERALEAAEKGADKESLHEGVKLIHKQFKELLKRFGVEEVTALYCKFDPNIHQAVMQVEGKEEEKDQTVVQEIEKGYLLKGKLLRPSKVVVCRYRPPQEKEGEEKTREEQA